MQRGMIHHKNCHKYCNDIYLMSGAINDDIYLMSGAINVFVGVRVCCILFFILIRITFYLKCLRFVPRHYVAEILLKFE